MIWLLLAAAWLGYAMCQMRILNYLYACPLPKRFLKFYRLYTGVAILLFPLTSMLDLHIMRPYLVIFASIAVVVLPWVTLRRWLGQPPGVATSTNAMIPDLPHVLGAGKNLWLARLPKNGLFDVELTRTTLKLQYLPKELHGVTVLVLSDLHFHGTPGREWFEALFDHLAALPTPDVVALLGDYLDDDEHHNWLAPLLGRLRWGSVGVAILGNHDVHHQPAMIRAEFRRLGYNVLSGGWQRLNVRGVPVVFVGDESPWLPGPADLPAAPLAGFRIYLTHTPDNYPNACAAMCDLVLAGHVHGGGIRLPLFGSIFVPSVYGRRYDQGVFRTGRTVMLVGRGISGKEPLRWNCPPQVLLLTLTGT